MLFTPPTQYAVLALLLIAGWLFGLASHPGGRKWRARYEAEREAHDAYREQTEARIDALQRENAALGHDRVAVPADPRPIDAPRSESVVTGKSVSVRVDLGGRRSIKKKI